MSMVTTRTGGFSTGPYAAFNLGTNSGDAPQSVARNRGLLRKLLPAEPLWMKQVHGIRVLDATGSDVRLCEADAAVAHAPQRVCAVLTADCLPVLLCERDGAAVGAVHGGWRGLAAGVVEQAVRALKCPPERVLAWLGPAIGPQAYEVGNEVREAFVRHDVNAAAAFTPGQSGKYFADLYLLARQRLSGAGVTSVHGGGWCTHTDVRRFFSYRRDGPTGRMASLVWIA
ncbi:MAG: peptidoglycan editing factor PgeF [Betaproteobacteria bacterium]|nr:peptidoglycan editing factor PgeF [Betaproteobacteria bacterium]